MIRSCFLLAAIAAIAASSESVNAQNAPLPAAIAAPGETVASFHAEGAQIYECKADGSGKLGWQFREPIATLVQNGKTVGRHFAGPSWELADGSLVTGKVVGNAPGASAGDIPWLKLDVAKHEGNGLLSSVTIVQRINTHGGGLNGGAAQGACEQAGSFLSVPYSAEYRFLK
jgi:hypothetical protein